MVNKQNFTVYQGADFRRVLELRNEANNLMDLTGYEFRGQARVSYTDQSPVFSFVFTLRDQQIEPGMVNMQVLASSTSPLVLEDRTDYLYDIEMVDTSGIVRRIVEGKIQVLPEVTK